MTVAGQSVADARRALLGRLIDHAAMFPPEELPLHAAVAVDRLARGTPESWMLNRFLVPAAKLAELPADFAPALGVVLSRGPLPELAGRRVEVVETPLENAAAVEGAPARVFLEVPASDDAALRSVAAAGVGAKVRCGGLVPEAYPAPADLAAFIAGCRDLRLPFKATAGLHHPIRDGIVHGFLNLLAAAVLAHSENAGEDEIESVLLEEDHAAFSLSADALTVCDHRLGAAAITAARAELFVGFGSCSFSEPVEELRALGML